MDSGEDTRKKRQIKRDSLEHSPSDDGAVVEKTKKLRKDAEAAVAGLEETGETAKTNPEVSKVPEKPVENSTTEVASEDQNIKAEEQPSDEKKESQKDPNENISNDIPKSSTGSVSQQKTNIPQPIPPRQLSTGEGQDLESALNILVGASEGQQERISDHSYLTFRMGHAGDASRLASWYQEKRKTTPKIQVEDDPNESTTEADNKEQGKIATKEAPNAESAEDNGPSSEAAPSSAAALEQEAASSLELWLADGLGDEDIPPSLFALLAHVNYDKDEDEAGSNTKASELAAVALLTVSWEHGCRVLRVEWLQVDSDLDNARLVERRM